MPTTVTHVPTHLSLVTYVVNLDIVMPTSA
jgi:hypothetical protein